MPRPVFQRDILGTRTASQPKLSLQLSGKRKHTAQPTGQSARKGLQKEGGGGGQREKTFLAAKTISSLSFFFSGKQRGPLSLSLSPFLSGSWPARRVPHHHSAYAAAMAAAAARLSEETGVGPFQNARITACDRILLKINFFT